MRRSNSYRSTRRRGLDVGIARLLLASTMIVGTAGAIGLIVESAASGATASKSSITIAYITDLTGQGAAENVDSPAGWMAGSTGTSLCHW
jgi:hypothetical protein